MIEIIITAVIAVLAVSIFLKNMKKKSSGCCDCGNCPQSTKSCCSAKNIQR